MSADASPLSMDSSFEPLITERLIIRPLVIEDRDPFFAYRSDPEVACYQGWAPPTLESVEDFLRAMEEVIPDTPDTWFQVGMCLREENRLIGDIGLHFLPDGAQIEIGYSLARAYWGCGYAVEGLTAVLNYCFGQLNKHRLTASVDPENQRSIALLERLGLRREAYHVKSLLLKGRWVDDVIYAILRDEWLSRSQVETVLRKRLPGNARDRFFLPF